MFLAEITWFHIQFSSKLVFLFHSSNLYIHSVRFSIDKQLTGPPLHPHTHTHTKPPTLPPPHILKTVPLAHIYIYRGSNFTITKIHTTTPSFALSPHQQSPTPIHRKKSPPVTHPSCCPVPYTSHILPCSKRACRV